jgi:hypothetical protein
MLDSDQMFLIAIPHTPIIRWQPNFSIAKKVGHVTRFWKALKRASKMMAQVSLLFFSQHNHYAKGDPIFFVAIQHAPAIRWRLNFFNYPKRKVGVVFSNDNTCPHPF